MTIKIVVSLLVVLGLLPTPAWAQKVPVTTRAARPFTGYHRYRGTVGGQPVTVELTIGPSPDAPDSIVCQGRYTYDRHSDGQLLLSSPRPYQPKQPIVLIEAGEAQPKRSTGRWQTSQPVAAVVSGTWTSPTGKQLPFRLRESYTNAQGRLMAVRYEVVGEDAKVPCRPEREEGETKAKYHTRIAGYEHGYSQQFLHLLGPDTLHHSLQAMQCPVPTVRRQITRAAAQDDDGCNFHTTNLHVDYNDYGLLAQTEYSMEEFITGARPQHNISATTHDLRTGQLISMSDVFRPDTDTLLQRIITQHLLRDDNPDFQPEPRMAVPVHAADLAPLPGSNFSLTGKGVEFPYYGDELQGFLTGSAIIFSVLVLYAELLPLLRPHSPVARMLRERGLWQAGNKQ